MKEFIREAVRRASFMFMALAVTYFVFDLLHLFSAYLQVR